MRTDLLSPGLHLERVRLADCSLNLRQVRGGSNNMHGLGTFCANSNKLSYDVLWTPATIAGRLSHFRGGVGERNLDLLQAAKTNERTEMMLKCFDVGTENLPILARRRAAGQSAIHTPQSLPKRVLGHTFKRLQVLPFVPLDRPFFRLRKEVSRNANHDGGNRSYDQALTHALFGLRHVGFADRILPLADVNGARDNFQFLFHRFEPE
jgi:hypothetical protein